MYNLNDKKSAIKEVQSYLLEIYGDNSVYQSGIFDEQTEYFVSLFQKENEIEQSGIVDAKTFNRLFIKYSDSVYEKTLLSTDAVFSILPLKPSAYLDEMLVINKMIADMLDYYGVYHSMRNSYYFSKETKRGVKELRKIMGLKDSDEIDVEFYKRLKKELAYNKNRN